ncbi:MAG: hypothetical protein KDC66_06740 [Phaeodactylibacter sp.]|nr:hypothetical protein [Phaeodactylibacter sp.]MCB9273550.1 hypothetical protein [Lewinellaceae bacterium]
MKTVLYIIAFILAGAGLQMLLPWWSMPLAAAVLALGFNLKAWPAFLGGFLGAALLWGGYAAYINLLNEGIMAGRIGNLFGGLSATMAVLLTAIFGGLFGGLGGLVGSLARNILPLS